MFIPSSLYWRVFLCAKSSKVVANSLKSKEQALIEENENVKAFFFKKQLLHLLHYYNYIYIYISISYK